MVLVMQGYLNGDDPNGLGGAFPTFRYCWEKAIEIVKKQEWTNESIH